MFSLAGRGFEGHAGRVGGTIGCVAVHYRREWHIASFRYRVASPSLSAAARDLSAIPG
jgi:hypothetical protein